VWNTRPLFYRGYRWSPEWLLDNVRVTASAIWHHEVIVYVTAVAPFSGELRDRLRRTLSGVSVFYPIWQRAHEARVREFDDGVVLGAVDGVPWEIHEIENESAYEAALAEYRRSSASLLR